MQRHGLKRGNDAFFKQAILFLFSYRKTGTLKVNDRKLGCFSRLTNNIAVYMPKYSYSMKTNRLQFFNLAV